MSTELVVREGDGGEMVLLAMLPQDGQVMVVQTPALRTIGDLEVFIREEYARVFPKKATLHADARIQKCVTVDKVLNRRKQSDNQNNSVKESSQVVATPKAPSIVAVTKARTTVKKSAAKLKLPADDAVAASSQETITDMSQDFLLSQSGSSHESNSVLLSSLSKNRFSLGSIPVPKLKKSSKNPFASVAATAETQNDSKPKARGRPPKAK
uniref:Uncharacterized protein n=1 Tax=Globisporangium ultimum (strain ATCC 200006 / CBS 805.95 / DAOM BR144) TaxID=431595 RepID=K3X8V5_GLOUD